MPSPAMLAFCLSSFGHLGTFPGTPALPPVSQANFGVGDTLFIVVIALVVFGPKKLPEISRQVGKLLYEFRKASNDFKFQIEEELRASEQAERQKELTAQAAVTQPATPIAITAGETVSAEPVIEGVRAPEPPISAAEEHSTADTGQHDASSPDSPASANHSATRQRTAGQHPLALPRHREHGRRDPSDGRGRVVRPAAGARRAAAD